MEKIISTVPFQTGMLEAIEPWEAIQWVKTNSARRHLSRNLQFSLRLFSFPDRFRSSSINQMDFSWKFPAQ